MKTKLNTLLGTIVVAFLLLLIPCNVQAATREYTFNVEKSYTAAKILIDFPIDRSEYSAVVYAPKRDVQYTVNVADHAGECIINDALEKGEWTVVVTRNDEPVVSEDGEVLDSSMLERPIDDVKIRFEGSTEKILDVDKDIYVTENIVGLSMYFKDDSFVAEWNDTSCGDVDIEVVNEANFQTLGKEKVSGRYYELPLDPSAVKSIAVKVVPSRSANVDGAGKQFTFVFDNHPDATVTYEDTEITNKDTIGAHVVLNNKYAVQILRNDKELQRTEYLDPGEYDFDLPTEIGDNDYTIYIIDENGNMRSTNGHTFKDVVAPILQMSKEYTEINTQDESIVIEGKIEDYENFTVNDTPVPVEGDHTFKYTYALKEGLNVIDFVATDKAGNVSQYTATVTRYIPEEKPIPWIKIIIVTVVVIMIGLYIWDAVRKHNGKGGFFGGGKSKKTAEKRPVKKKNDRDAETADVKGGGLMKDLLELFIPLIVVIVIFNFVIGVAVIQSSSMEPTLMTGNTVFVNRLCYKTGQEIKRGDIIVFKSDEHGKVFGKRVIGLPGDHIEFSDGYVVINGQYCDESAYIGENIETNCSKTFDVPEGCYFLLGDNRENSNDSRFWKNPYIPKNKIIGRYMGQIDFSIQYDIINRLAGK